jgi:ubiquinone/menaquinone biosynthesis C-methylase UbiE
MPDAWPEPDLLIPRGDGLPYLVEHWYLGPRPMRYMMVRRFREVLRHADLAPGQRVLDLGCGWAYGTLWARERGCRVTGVDLAHDQLAWARRALPDATSLGLTQANAKTLPFADEQFDRVISVEMLEHVFRPDRDHVFREIARVLKPGGKVALSTPNTVSPIEVAKHALLRWPALRRRLPSACFPEATDDAASYHPYRYHHPLPRREIAERLEGAGLSVLGSRRFLWVFKTLPESWLAPARAAESLAESTPLVARLGATTLVWAEKPVR